MQKLLEQQLNNIKRRIEEEELNQNPFLKNKALLFLLVLCVVT